MNKVQNLDSTSWCFHCLHPRVFLRMLAKANFARPLLAWSVEGAHSPSSAGSSQDLQLGIISRPTNRVLCQKKPVLGFHLKVQQRASCLTGPHLHDMMICEVLLPSVLQHRSSVCKNLLQRAQQSLKQI